MAKYILDDGKDVKATIRIPIFLKTNVENFAFKMNISVNDAFKMFLLQGTEYFKNYVK